MNSWYILCRFLEAACLVFATFGRLILSGIELFGFLWVSYVLTLEKIIIRIGYGIQLGHHLQASVSGIICLIWFIESVINCDLVIFFEIYLCDFLHAQLVNGSCNYFLCFWWQPPAAITVVLNVRMHCEACAQGLRKRIRKIQGIYFHWHSFPTDTTNILLIQLNVLLLL